METDDEIISTAILALSLIQEEQLSFTGKSVCTKYWLTANCSVGLSLPSVSRLTDRLDMTLVVLTGL